MVRVGIDLDGVIYPFIEELAQYVARTTGRDPLEMAGYTRWEVWEDWGYTKRQFNDFAEAGTADSSILVNGDPLPGAKTALRRIHKLGHTVHIITARGFGPRARPLTCEWLTTHKIPHDTLTFAYDKRVMRVNVMLDDKPANVDALREIGCAAYLLDTGRNDQKGHPFLVSGWDAFLDIIEAKWS